MSSPGDERPPADRDRPEPTAPFPPGQFPPARPPYGARYGGQSPYAGPAGNAPEDPPYVYNPYGNFTYPASYPSSPAGLGAEPELPPKRPGSVHLALLLVVVSALPFLLIGLVAVAGAGQAAVALPPEDLAQLQQVGIDVAQLVRTTGLLIAAVAL